MSTTVVSRRTIVADCTGVLKRWLPNKYFIRVRRRALAQNISNYIINNVIDMIGWDCIVYDGCFAVILP